MSTLQHRLNQSSADFQRAVWPHFADALGGGELVPVETVTDSAFATLLDTLGMTDVWQIIKPHGMRSLATRVQWGQTNWATWTVRCRLRSGRPTEFQKLTQYGEWQLPQYVIQAYIDRPGGALISAAAIKTRDLQQILINGWHDPERINPKDGNGFYPVSWLMARLKGFQIVEISA